MKFILFFLLTLFFSTNTYSSNLNIYSLGIYDVKFDGSEDKQTTDFRYDRRFDNTLFDIGPEEDNFFFLKPFVGFEYTGDSAYYFLTGIYLEDNLGQLLDGKENNVIFTPSFGVGYYDDGSGKELGNEIQFRTNLEISYVLKNDNRIGLSFSHISNANIGDKNPGVEVISFSYQIPY
tara:strand:+ start:485 stop:1015 length:531 start_codon:yes stop_codon:yes gene_type:complete